MGVGDNHKRFDSHPMDRVPLIASRDATSGASLNLIEPDQPRSQHPSPNQPTSTSSAEESQPKRVFPHGATKKGEGKVINGKNPLPLQKSGDGHSTAKMGSCNLYQFYCSVEGCGKKILEKTMVG